MKKERIDCLFIHTPGQQPHDIHILFMAMGVFALADYIKKHGFSSKIIHLGVEKIVNPHFSLQKYIEDKEILLIGISLHWYRQSREVMRTVNAIKKIYPRAKIVLGGFTGSYFSREIMEMNKNVDFIIQGDAEIPLLKFMNALKYGNVDLKNIPNLRWRDDKGAVIQNNQIYVAAGADLDTLSFTNFDLMEHFETYTKLPFRLSTYSSKLLRPYRIFFLCIGRGCTVNCSFCGGSRRSQELINKRKHVAFRSPERVIESIKDAIREGIEVIYISFDPVKGRDYYHKLFKIVREKKLHISVCFECWFLPSVRFINDFKRTFGNGKYSTLILSPETASEKVRRLNKGFMYSNKHFFSTVDRLMDAHIRTDIYFSYPLPGETELDAKKSLSFIRKLREKVGQGGKVLVQHFGFDPASPMYLNPQKYDITKKFQSFEDYYNFGKKDGVFRLHDNLYETLHKEDKGSEYERDAQNKYSLKEYEKAIESINKAFHLGYTSGNIQFLLGLCYEGLGRYQYAIKSFKKAETLNPDRAQINYALFTCYKKLNMIKNANFELKKWLLKSKSGKCYF